MREPTNPPSAQEAPAARRAQRVVAVIVAASMSALTREASAQGAEQASRARPAEQPSPAPLAERPAVLRGETITFRPRLRARRRDRWSMSLAWGGSAGVAGPLGLVGTFVEFRPWRYVAANVGVGAGGSFGPAGGAWLSIDPLSLRWFTLGLTANASVNISLVRGKITATGPEWPTTSAWAGMGAQAQLRPTRSTFVRLSAGYQWLLDVQRFRVATEDALNGPDVPRLPFASPVDAARAAARSESYGLPFAHFDLGTYWNL